MEYLALYRKYRPTDIDSVVGQSEIKKILESSIKNGTITHAYLFSGPRGTGKTTMAKILAKMVNCGSLVDGHACNECASCKNLFTNNDVIEIDAASNNGVDEIRDLREKASLVPSLCKYKVYIIDEVHMLTTQAFNALLKTLEEPPKHVIFILATTEYHKIPLTITSRCQKFQFNKIENNDIVDRLKKISELENINITDEALFEIARISDGGMRDSINFLDQLRSFNVNEITISDVFDVCGNISLKEIAELFIDIKNNDAEKITLFFDKMNVDGKNYGKFFDDVICFLKDTILFKKNVNHNLIKSKIEYVEKIANLYSIDEIFYIVEGINSLIDKLKFVSRQSVVVSTNFLLFMYKINSNNINNGSKIDDMNNNIKNESDNEEKYELAFNFTSSDKVSDSEVMSPVLHEVNVKVDVEVNNYNKNKEILINNAFAVADKNIKNTLQTKYANLSDYLTDKKYASIAGILLDTKIEVAGDGYIILTGNYDAIVDKVYNNLKLCEDFINHLFNKTYNFVVITDNEWNKYRDDYVNSIKSGKKYTIMELSTEILDKEIMDKEPTIVDKLFELVGEDSIEFR